MLEQLKKEFHKLLAEERKAGKKEAIEEIK